MKNCCIYDVNQSHHFLFILIRDLFYLSHLGKAGNMDLYDDIFNDQSLQFSPLRLSPSPEPFTSIVDVLQDPLVEETENVGEETVGLINNFAVSEANPSMSAQSPDLIPLPDTLTLVQYPPEVEQLLLCTPHGYMQENLPNIQSDQPFLFDQNMLDAFQEPEVFAIVM